ncbi:MAG: alpha/beta hydrolase [Ruthenibacterium sp.]
MERKYVSACTDAMQKNKKIVDVKGVSVLVKPIPEGGEPGDLDPRVYKSMKMMPLMAKLMPKPKKEATPLEQILPLRKMFGEYKGTYIADEGVETQFFNVPSADGYKVPMRVYRREKVGKNIPMLVYYHGGGFFGGSPEIVEQMCKLLVQNIDCVVFNVDYRLCPENHYPAPLDDCFFATKWAYDNAARFGADANRLAVGGDSAGGNLAAAVTLRDRAEKTGMVKLQVLLYPAVNLSGKNTEFYHGTDVAKYQHSKHYWHRKVLDTSLGMMNSMMGDGANGNMLENIYLQGNLSSEHPYASPLLADMKGLPPTLLIFGEHDFLAFEDFAYAQTAQKAGVPLKTIVYRGIGHGFADQIGVAPQAEDCIKEIASTMNEIL